MKEEAEGSAESDQLCGFDGETGRGGPGRFSDLKSSTPLISLHRDRAPPLSCLDEMMLVCKCGFFFFFFKLVFVVQYLIVFMYFFWNYILA